MCARGLMDPICDTNNRSTYSEGSVQRAAALPTRIRPHVPDIDFRGPGLKPHRKLLGGSAPEPLGTPHALMPCPSYLSSCLPALPQQAHATIKLAAPVAAVEVTLRRRSPWQLTWKDRGGARLLHRLRRSQKLDLYVFFGVCAVLSPLPAAAPAAAPSARVHRRRSWPTAKLRPEALAEEGVWW